MRKSQIISLTILLVVVSLIIIVVSTKDRPNDNIQSMKPTIAPATQAPTMPPATDAVPTEPPATATPTPVTKPVINDFSKFDQYSKKTLKIATKDKENINDEVVFSDSSVTTALRGFDYLLSNPGTNNTTDIYICVMLNKSSYNTQVSELLDFAQANSVKLSFFAAISYLNDSTNHNLIRRIHAEGHTLGIRGNFVNLTHAGLCDAAWNMELQYQTILSDASFRTYFYTPERSEYSQRDVAVLNELGYRPVFRYQGKIDSTTDDKTYDGVILRAYLGDEDVSDSKMNDIISYITWGLQQGYKFAGLSK